ncbi:alpha/beta fold hydrolase [Bradyrhizobium canariense]|nr:alpha/beta hydrolase [Bradyrhizobium canariense]
MRQGQGSPLLFLHGANGASVWLPVFEELSKSFDVIVPEHPGFGQSDDPEWITSIPDIAMFYLNFIEQLDLSDVALVGTSLGGWIAAEIAVRNATRLSSLTLVGPAGVRVKGIPMGDTFMWGPEEGVRNLFANQAIADRMLSMKPTDEQLAILLKNRFTATKLAWEPRGYNPHLEKWLHRIKVPTQIIWGSEDRLIPSQYVKRWKERIPHAAISLVENCGHLPHIERSDVVVETIKNLTGKSA